jgi:hypothetical protein
MKTYMLAIIALFALSGFVQAEPIVQTLVVQPQALPGQKFRASENSQRLSAGTYVISLAMPAGVTVSVNLDVPGPDLTVIKNAKAGEDYKIVIEPKTIPEITPPFTGARGIYFGDLKGATEPVSVKLTIKKIKA